MAGKLIVVSMVFGITAICVIAIATAGSEGYRRVTEVSAPVREATDSPGAKPSLTPQDARRMEVEKAVKERDSKIAQPPTESSSPSPVGAAQEGKSAPGAPDRNEYDILASAFFGDSAQNLGSGHSVIASDESAPPEAKTAVEQDRIEREMTKLKADMVRRTNTVANRLKLDQNQRESLTQIAEQTTQQIRVIREQFGNSQMTEYDREIMRNQIRDVNRAAAESIRYVLGDEKYKEFKKESSYYKNPDQRIYDMQKSIDAQKTQLDRIERGTRSNRKNPASDKPAPPK
jgi:hypothetical protein